VVPTSETARIIPPGVAEAARHFVEGSTEQALAALQAAGAAEGECAPLNFMTALVAWRLGDVALALTMSRSCFEQEPENGTIAEAVASLYAQVGNLVESLFYGKLATALKPDETMRTWLPSDFPSFGAAFLSIREKPLLGQAKLLLAGGNPNAALDKTRQHIEVAPDDREGRLFYAEQLLRAGLAGQAVGTVRPLLGESTVPPPVANVAGRALASVGEAREARHWHDYACATAPEDAAIMAARLADAPWIGLEGGERGRSASDWAARFAAATTSRRWRAGRDSLVVGYLVSRIPDHREALAIAAVARAHARPSTTVIGYGLGPQSWDENAALQGAFDQWRDTTGFDARTLAKTVAVDGLDVVIDVGGFAAPGNLRALAYVNSAIRVAWLCDTTGLERVVYDALIGSASTELVAWQPPLGAYPLIRDWARPCPHKPDASFRFGVDATLAEISADTVAQWRAALEAVSGSVLLLRAHDMAHPENVDRLVARVGTELASRVDIVDAAACEDFYSQVDVALAPAVSLLPHMVAEAIACGVPVLAVGEDVHARALRLLGLGDFVFTDVAACAAAAGNLAGSPARLAEARRKAIALADRGERAAAEIAATIEREAKAMLGKAAA
jgi:protein O-GlcNAc transferase